MDIMGENVSLRKMEISDTKNIIKWRNNLNVKKNFFIQEDLTEKTHYSWIKNNVNKCKVVQFIIVNNKLNKDIGTVFLKDIDKKNSKAEFGIFIGEDSERGKGLGAEATVLICNYAFQNLNLHRIYLRVFDHNDQAKKSYYKAGFRQEGILKDDVFIKGKFYNVVIMSIVNSYGKDDI